MAWMTTQVMDPCHCVLSSVADKRNTGVLINSHPCDTVFQLVHCQSVVLELVQSHGSNSIINSVVMEILLYWKHTTL